GSAAAPRGGARGRPTAPGPAGAGGRGAGGAGGAGGAPGAGGGRVASTRAAPLGTRRNSTRGVVQPLASTSSRPSVAGRYPSGIERGSSRNAWRPGRRFVNENFPVESVVATSPSSVQMSMPASPASPDL